MNPSWIHLAAGSRPARGLPEQTDRQARLCHLGGLFQTPLYHPALAGTPPEEGNWNPLAGESAHGGNAIFTARLSSPNALA